MPPSLSELKVTPSFCFPFKIPDDPTATNNYLASPFKKLVPRLPKTIKKFIIFFSKPKDFYKRLRPSIILLITQTQGLDKSSFCLLLVLKST